VGPILGSSCGTVRNIYLGNSLTGDKIGSVCESSTPYHTSKLYIGNNIYDYIRNGDFKSINFAY